MFLFKTLKFSLLLTVGLLVLDTSSAAPQWESILGTIVQHAASNLWQNNAATFLGHQCRYTMEPTFKNWELVYRGRFWCPGLAPFAGVGEHVSRDGTIERAQKDFARKALEANLFSREDLAVFLRD